MIYTYDNYLLVEAKADVGGRGRVVERHVWLHALQQNPARASV